MVKIANDTEMSTVFDRYQLQKPQCKFGTDGVCCRLCHMGPCRITPKAHLGICGADADTITARNLLREIAAGTAAHSDHGRMLVRTLKAVANGKGGDYKIVDPGRLHEAAELLRNRHRRQRRPGHCQRSGGLLPDPVRLVGGAQRHPEAGSGKTPGSCGRSWVSAPTASIRPWSN